MNLNHVKFSKNNSDNIYLRLLMNHDKDIWTNQGKKLTNLTLEPEVAENDHLTTDREGKMHYYPHIKVPHNL